MPIPEFEDTGLDRLENLEQYAAALTDVIGGGGSISVKDGSTTVSPTTTLTFDGAIFEVTDEGSAEALVAIPGFVFPDNDDGITVDATDNTGLYSTDAGNARTFTLKNVMQTLRTTAVKTADYTAHVGQLVRVSTASGARQVTLPDSSAVQDASVVAVKLTAQASTNAVQVLTAGSDVFDDGTTSSTLTQVGEAAIFVALKTGAVWTRVNGHCYLIGGTDVAVADGGTGASTAGGARTNLGLVIGTDVEAHDTDLTAIAALAPSNDDVIQRKAGAWTNRTLAQLIADLSGLGTTFQPLDSDLTAIAALTTTAYGRALLALADAAALQTAGGLVIGTNVEAHDADLTTIAGLSPSNDDVIQRKAGAWTNRTIAQLLTDLAAAGTTFQPLDSDLTAIAALSTTAYGRSLLAAADAAALRTLAGAVIGTNVQAWDADLDAIAALTSAADKLPYSTGAQAWALADLTAFARTFLDDADAATVRATLGVIASLFQSGGAQALALDTLAATTDITTLNASTSAHGLLKKLSNVASQYMDGSGAWSTPVGTTMVQLADSTAGGNVASFDLTSISGSYNHLLMIVSLRGDAATTGDNANLRLNNDSGSVYDEETILLSNTTISGNPGTASAIQGIRTAGGNSTANSFGGGVVIFPNYTGSQHKGVLILASGVTATEGTNSTYRYGSEWAQYRSTSAVSRITLTPGSSGNFVAGSRVTLYGLK